MKSFDDITLNCKDVKQIARGGQKIVYKADHPDHGNVVIKLFIENNDTRLLREIEISTNMLESEFVPKIYDHGEVQYQNEDSYYIIEEMIEGKLLRDFIIEEQSFSLDDAVGFLEQGFTFIKDLENCKVVHRDIKPENIILSNSGKYYFLDLGIARALEMDSLTRTEAMGPHTPGYAAPEVFNNMKEDIDSRADIFSLGVVTYECLFNENPYRPTPGLNPFQIWNNTMTINPVERQIIGDEKRMVMGLISTMMQKSASARPKNATQGLNWLNSVKK